MAENYLKEWLEAIRAGKRIDFDSSLRLAETVDPAVLAAGADGLRLSLQGDKFDLCSIINGKSGRCSEDCRFCAQSSWYETAIDEYSQISNEEALLQAKDNASNGIERFSIVTAGRSLTSEQIDDFGAIYQAIRDCSEIKLCASMGMLTKEKAEKLQNYGVTRYHCNLEAARSFFPKFVQPIPMTRK